MIKIKSVIPLKSLCVLVQMVRPLAAIDLTCVLNLQKFGLTTDEDDPPDQAYVEFCIQIRMKIKILIVPEPGSG
jgi:hypothetical protein